MHRAGATECSIAMVSRNRLEDGLVGAAHGFALAVLMLALEGERDLIPICCFLAIVAAIAADRVAANP
jgi:hypothetical protein